MKQLLILIFTFSILLSCKQNKSEKIQLEIESKADLKTETELFTNTELENVQSEKKKDTIYNYWELILDTITSQKEFKIINKKHSLELKTFSLNDSLIVRNLARKGKLPYYDHSHTMVTDFKLLSGSIIHQKRIDRTDFEKALIPEFYEVCNLFSTDIDSIIGNTVYLTSELAKPDTDNQWRVWYKIKINNNRIGNLEFTETKYVGL